MHNDKKPNFTVLKQHILPEPVKCYTKNIDFRFIPKCRQNGKNNMKGGASDRGPKWFAHLPSPKFSNSTPNLIFTFSGGGGGWQLTFDAESKNAKVQD